MWDHSQKKKKKEKHIGGSNDYNKIERNQT